jgi:hypothetical protein
MVLGKWKMVMVVPHAFCNGWFAHEATNVLPM